MARRLINEQGYDPQKLQVLLGGWNAWLAKNTQDPKTYPIATGSGTGAPTPVGTPTTSGQAVISTPTGPQWTATAMVCDRDSPTT